MAALKPNRLHLESQPRSLSALSIAVIAFLCLVVISCGPRPPNIVYIISDDQGYGDFGFMGSSVIETPNLDELAASGVVFTHGYSTSSSCRPSLSSLLTGLHPAQWDARVDQLTRQGHKNLPMPFMQYFQTLPRLLKEKGYRSFQAGKHWEGHYSLAGFDEGAAGLPSEGSEERLSALAIYSGGSGLEIARTTMEPAKRFILENKDQPFLLWFAPMLPHLPFDAPEELVTLYRERGLDFEAPYYANVTWFDRSVGELIQALKDAGVYDETLIVFVADNGWEWDAGKRTNAMIGGPHGKLSIFEPGFRTPIILSLPGTVPEGVVRDELVSAVDLFPTVLELAQIPTPGDRHGVSLWPAIRGEERHPRDFVAGGVDYLRYEPTDPRVNTGFGTEEVAWFLRTPTWRYIRYPERDQELLFNMTTDPDEVNNLAAKHPGILEEMRRKLDEWRADVTRYYVP